LVYNILEYNLKGVINMIKEKIQLGDLLKSEIIGKSFNGDEGFKIEFHKDNLIVKDSLGRELILDYTTNSNN
jgi:hypothetical protein